MRPVSCSGDNSRIGIKHAHSLGLRGCTASDLLDTELVELGLQLLQLVGEIILALSPELTSLDLCRLPSRKLVSFRSLKIHRKFLKK